MSPLGTVEESVMTITGHLLRFLSASLIVVLTASPCLSAPTVIAELGSAPLLGPNTTLAGLQASIARNDDRLATAADLVGMTAAEYRAFRIATQTQRPDWGRVPQRLDAMSWYGGGRVHVIRDVEIPRATFGFEYDIAGPAERLRIFLPVACGNLSIVRERIRRAAAHKPPMRVAAIAPRVVAPQAAAAAPVAPAPQAIPTAIPTPAPTIYLGSRPAHGFFPFLATFFGFIAVGGGHKSSGGGGNGGGTGGGGCGCTKNPN